MMTPNTFFSCCISMLLLISCGEGNTTDNNNTTVEETFTTPVATAEAPELTKEDKIKLADAMMMKIEAAKNEQTMEKKRYSNPKEAHDQSIYTVYSQGGKIVKVSENIGESMYLSDATYYYQNDEIFLVHTLTSFDDNMYNETKVYLEEGKPVAAAGRSKGEQDMDTDLASLNIEIQELNTVIPDMTYYMTSLSEIPTRLAASTPE